MASNEPEQVHLENLQTEPLTSVETVPLEISMLSTFQQTDTSGSSSNHQRGVHLEQMQSEPLTPMETVLDDRISSPNHLQTEPSGSRSKSEMRNSVSSQSLKTPSTPTSTTATVNTGTFYKKPFVYGETDNGRVKFIKVNNADIGKCYLLKTLSREVLKKCPHLENKRLLLSITDGADLELKDVQSETFKNGIKKILPGTCLVTGGTNTNVTKLVGECVRCFNDSVKGKNSTCMAIGIVNLENSANLKFLKNKDVIGIDEDGTLYLKDFSGTRWTLNPAVLPKYCITTSKKVLPSEENHDICTDDSLRFKQGDIVKISSYPNTMQNLKGKTIEQTIGKIGTVTKVESNFDLQIHVCGTKLLYAPDDVTLLPPESLNRQLKEWLKKNTNHRKNTLVRIVLSGDVNKMKDQLNEVITKQKPTRVDIDYNGDLYLKDRTGKRITIKLDEQTDVIASSVNYIRGTAITTNANSSSDQPVAIGDLVQICNDSWQFEDMQEHEWRIRFDRTNGKIGTVLKSNAGDLEIDLCGHIYQFKQEDVAVVSFDSVASQLKKWFETHTPIDTKDKMVKAVLTGNVGKVRQLLRRAKKDTEMFGIDEEGFLFVVDVTGKRTFNVVRGSICSPIKVGDIVMICSDKRTLEDLQTTNWRYGMERTLGRIGTVLEVHTNIEMRIKVCGVEWWFKPQVVGLVSLERLTHRLNVKLQTEQPDNNDTLLNAVLTRDVIGVGKELNNSLKAQVVFGLDDGDLFSIDNMGQRHIINVDGTPVIPTFAKGDLVQIRHNQIWKNGMEKTIDKFGIVRNVEPNNDLLIGEWTWRYRPYAVKKVSLEKLTGLIKKWVEMYMLGREDDEMRKAVLSEDFAKVRELLSSNRNEVFGIDKDGSLFVMDVSNKRRTFTVAGNSIHPTYSKGDIIQICSKEEPGTIATVVKYRNTDELLIIKCGVRTNVSRNDVKLVPLNRLTSELNTWFKIYNSTSEADEMVNAVQTYDTSNRGLSQRVCSIDKDGSLCIKDTSDKRRKFILADGSIYPTFFEGDIVHICREAKHANTNEIRKDDIKLTVGKIGRIVKVAREATEDCKLRIQVGADTYSYSPEDVSLVSIVYLTRQFKMWLEENRPQLENQTFGKAVLVGNKEAIRDVLTQKHQQNGVFGIDDDGDVYVTDIAKKRQKLTKAEKNDDTISHSSMSMEPTRFDADGSTNEQIVEDDLVRISNDQSIVVVMQGDSGTVDMKEILGKYGKVVKVKKDNAIEIEACGLTLHCSKNAVVTVSLESLTKRLNVWFEANWPKPDRFGKAVMSNNYRKVAELLCNSIETFNLQDGTNSDLKGIKRPQQLNGSERQLDLNHGLFIIVDEAVVQSCEGIIGFRAQLQNHLISEMSTLSQKIFVNV